MKRIPRYVATILILALLNVSYINLALASSVRSPEVPAASPVSTPAPVSNNVPDDTDPCSPKVTKKCIENDIDTAQSDFNNLKNGSPFATQFFNDAGFDPTDDVTDAKTDLGNLTDADVDNNNFGRLHRKFQKHHQQITSILHNPSVMALLRSLAPVKFHVVVTSAAGSVAPGKNKALLISSTTQDMNRSFPSLKSAATRGAFAKGLTGLNVVVVPESTGAQCTTGDGTPHGINDVIIARAVAFLAEAAKEAIPDDLEAIIPHSIAVVAWAVAKGAELLLDSAHSIYTECKTLQDGDKVDSDLQSIKGSVSTTNSSLTTISSNVTNIKGNVTDIKTTVDGINSHTDIDKDAIITKIGDSAGKTTDAVNTSTTTITNNIGVVNNTVNTINTNVNTANTNINTINTKVDNVNTNIDNSRTTIINNAAANTKALTDFSLRLMIEADLASPDSSTPLALFETPGSKGGYLELVRTIVVATIGNLAGAGATQANSFLTQADAYYKAGNFKATYAYYRKAYKSAAN